MRRLGFLIPLLLVGCAAAEPSYPLRSHTLGPIDPTRLPAAAEVSPTATFATWKADAARLIDDIPRAVKRSHWGLLEVVPPGVAKPGEKTGPIRAEALLPDNRTAVIHAWAVNDGEVAAAVHVGRFGDPRVEEAFLQMLADVLADKPKPKRGGTFELPAK